ncbi:Membrane associated serine protease, rhomboid family [Granulicella pectinivorans]|uniref:Membrane associated serine protease, rhomboid family n=1 Tax=Granulicella pectinivorans TaxID=474950 RepID=A0A1I6M2C5_9BACT|nr:rhomboid family intramembrane serine protease [Granulicella pectinivorans]SFS09778.1 Membrane associated serine protease, rhomboid family [Granulicella pectinivorans]
MQEPTPEYLPPLDPTPAQVIPQSFFIVTWTLIALNVLVYAAMCLKGISPISPTSTDVLPWGADFGPLTLTGEWWRILTSTFLHFGILHIGMNMYILYQVGPFTELLYGRTRFLILYLLAGLGGSIVSLAIHPLTTSAGASGAIFGVYGALLAFLVVQRGIIPAERSKSIAQSAGVFLLYNLFFGLSSKTTDLSAHGGGFVAGFLCGVFLARPAVAGTRRLPVARTAMVALAGLTIAVISLQALAKHDHFEGGLYREFMLSPHVPFGDKGTILYSGSATKAEAQSLSQALAQIDDFKNSNIDLLLLKRNGHTDVFYMVNDKAASSADVAAAVGEATRHVASSIGGLPITAHLVDEELQDRTSIPVE